MASTTITNARAVVDGTVKACNLKLVDNKIKGIMPAGDTYGKTYDAKNHLVLPGFIDIHNHGGNGVDFNHADCSDILAARDYLASIGITTFLPTIHADTEEAMLRAMLSVIKTKNTMACGQIYGINLEGPFLSPMHHGSSPAELLQPCSHPLFKRLQDASGGNVKLTTISPELEGAAALIRKLSIEGVRISLGHTDAGYDQGVAAIEAGAISCTHFGHRMSTITPLSPTVTSALLESDSYCEVICDPDLLHPAMLRLLIKVKGLHRMVAETNSLTTPSQMLRYIVEATGLPLPKAVSLLTENPAKLLGIYHAKGSLDVGKDADFTVLDNDYNVIATFFGGEIIFGE